MTAVKKSAKKTSVTTPEAGEATQPADALPAKAAKAVEAPVKAAAAKSPKPAKKLASKSKAASKSSPEVTAKAAPAKKATPKSGLKTAPKSEPEETATLLDSQVTYEGALFRVQRDHIIEPGGREGYRDIIKHNGSVVILAVDPAKRKKDPWIVIERQYRHAAGQFLWELPAGKLDSGETPLEGAKRELAEETGYSAKKWSPLVDYFASPGFLGEAMKVFLAEGLVAGDAHPEEDEEIDFRLVRLSELLELVDKGKIIDGKTLTTILLYARKLGLKRK